MLGGSWFVCGLFVDGGGTGLMGVFRGLPTLSCVYFNSWIGWMFWLAEHDTRASGDPLDTWKAYAMRCSL